MPMFDTDEFPVGSPEWREFHVKAGDAVLEKTLGIRTDTSNASENTRNILLIRALAEVAQAHYLAANVRYRPS